VLPAHPLHVHADRSNSNRKAVMGFFSMMVVPCISAMELERSGLKFMVSDHHSGESMNYRIVGNSANSPEQLKACKT
jgi:hypothetical protein